MDIKIFNIDSKTRNTTLYTSANNFTYNTVDATVNSVVTVEPFNEKNVIELNILSIELSTSITMPTDDVYFFLKINDLGNIINNNTRYVAKIIKDVSTDPATYKFIKHVIKMDQPVDIKELKVSLVDRLGNLVNANSTDFSFTMQVSIINNSILKEYNMIKFYSEPVMNRILQAKMLAYYEKQIDPVENNSLTGTYNNNLTNLNNIMEYNPNGNRMNYGNIESSFFTNMDK